MTRTSQSDPLKIDVVACERGEIGMTICPGKKGSSEFGKPWDRDLATDVQVIVDWRPAAVVTLMEEYELASLGVADIGAAVGGAGIEWFHLPVVDGSTPDAAFERRWADVGGRLRELLQQGGRVLIHCRGGLGRTGLVAARLLVESGEAPEAAIAKVRAARRGAIETSQEAYVRRCVAPA